ncbi:NUDIX domain-containing protein [Paenibacillus donghaensis]|uniref:NUDIX domain-containing protein n=1 Tax=Paenibacillus donghaensis TaxID=414771 RepID=UPI0018834B85|nr:NUDIX domain-containing protein [Paenibacillus donghaensis]MBE9915827.1 NUDIX domain-containing protein [Paenibacillus donghaensis]
MNQSIYENWNGHRIKLTWIPGEEKPDPALVTSVHGICLHQGLVLAVHVQGRGYNLPGGHVEPGETPEEAFHREVLEEGSVKGKIEYLGKMEVSHEENALFDPNGKYPLVGYQLFYRMDVTERLPFNREHESLSRIWIEPEELGYVVNEHELIGLVLKNALQRNVNQSHFRKR